MNCVLECMGLDDNIEQYLKDYNDYLERHINGVRKAYSKFKELFPDILSEVKSIGELDMIIANHDSSKYSVEEYEPYALYFNVDKEKYSDIFDIAWNYHQKRNPHHWQYWLLRNDDGDFKALDMPIEYIIEMVCDWWSFSINQNNPKEIVEWYKENKKKQQLSDKTKEIVEKIIKTIDNNY